MGERSSVRGLYYNDSGVGVIFYPTPLLLRIGTYACAPRYVVRGSAQAYVHVYMHAQAYASARARPPCNFFTDLAVIVTIACNFAHLATVRGPWSVYFLQTSKRPLFSDSANLAGGTALALLVRCVAENIGTRSLSRAGRVGPYSRSLGPRHTRPTKRPRTANCVKPLAISLGINLGSLKGVLCPALNAR